MSGNGPMAWPAARPWVGLFAPPAAWYGCQQGLGWAMHVACAAGGPPIGPIVGAVALAVCILAGWIAWPVARSRASETGGRTRRFLARLGVGAAGLFGLGVAYTTFATVVVPPCAR